MRNTASTKHQFAWSAVLAGGVVAVAVGLVSCIGSSSGSDLPPVASPKGRPSACQGTEALPDHSPGPTKDGGSRLRIVNHGPEPLCGFVVVFPGEGRQIGPLPWQFQEIKFGDVPVGTTTEYRNAPYGVYRYGIYRYSKEGKERIQPVVDFDGEVPGPPGAYTYDITYNGLSLQIFLLTRDQ